MLIAAASAPAVAAEPSTCFDFAKSDWKALAVPIPFRGPDRADTTASGPHPQGGGWGSARGMLKAPIGHVFKLLREQKTLKNPKDADLEVAPELRPGLADFQTVEVTIHPFPLISVHWTEQWAYRVVQGTESTPQEVLIAYQKTAGTGHIRRFCGNIWLKPDGPASTDFAVYEEADADYRSAEAIAQGHLGTLRTLRAQSKDPRGN